MNTRPRPVKYRRKNKLRFIEKPGAPGVELRPHQVLLEPLVTEKGTHQSTRYNAYTFRVALISTKTDIKKAVEELFNVRVVAIRTQIRHGKERRFRQKIDHMPDWKKAIVTLHVDDKIEFF
jgi:large subunit ribosomal protein L23